VFFSCTWSATCESPDVGAIRYCRGAEIAGVDNAGVIDSEFSCNNTANCVKKAKCN